ncbi:hypothetical protein DMUE_0855 [Dictyocoela muelleri]|nr:hypothetical protein DMUE_0855 [Dictyocoela muelleri]
MNFFKKNYKDNIFISSYYSIITILSLIISMSLILQISAILPDSNQKCLNARHSFLNCLKTIEITDLDFSFNDYEKQNIETKIMGLLFIFDRNFYCKIKSNPDLNCSPLLHFRKNRTIFEFQGDRKYTINFDKEKIKMFFCCKLRITFDDLTKTFNIVKDKLYDPNNLTCSNIAILNLCNAVKIINFLSELDTSDMSIKSNYFFPRINEIMKETQTELFDCVLNKNIETSNEVSEDCQDSKLHESFSEEIDETDETEEIDETDETDEIEETDEIDETEEIGEIVIDDGNIINTFENSNVIDTSEERIGAETFENGFRPDSFELIIILIAIVSLISLLARIRWRR